jgi:ADP-heptose:LPS heptosyltransferase
MTLVAVPPRSIVISRTDKIGDVVLTLPMAGVIKKHWPNTKVIFLGQSYTRPIVECSRHVDVFWDWRDIQKLSVQDSQELCSKNFVDAIVHVFPQRKIAQWAVQARIPLRIGTRNRMFHWLRCNRLVPVSRRHSKAHEAELNMALLRGAYDFPLFKASALASYYGLVPREELNEKHLNLLDSQRVNVVLHPKSKGSAREWPLEKWKSLAEKLPRERFKIFVSGGPEEEKELLSVFPRTPAALVENIAGTMSLSQFVSFIAKADGLVAASTGPLHIAASFGRHALGLYPPIEPMHGGRWGPLGPRASYISVDANCEKCRHGGVCACMESISVNAVSERILERFAKCEE